MEKEVVVVARTAGGTVLEAVAVRRGAFGWRPSRHLGQVVRRVGHGLHAARDDDVRLAEHDLLRAQHDGLDAGGAHLVHRRAAGGLLEAGAQRCLPRRRLRQEVPVKRVHRRWCVMNCSVRRRCVKGEGCG